MNITQEIRNKISEKINVNLQKFDLVDYNHLIARTINENIVESINLSPIEALTKDIIGFVNKKEIYIQEIVEMVIKEARECRNDQPSGGITAVIEEESHWVNIYLDTEENVSTKECRFRLSVGNTDGYIYSFQIKPFPWSHRKDINLESFIKLRKLDQVLFRLYSAQVKVNMEEVEFLSTSWDLY
jgi:hypothetical protein